MSRAATTTTTDVLIVGAGPVGMTMALELSLQGVSSSSSFRLVDKTSTRSDKSRAIGVHTRTMELLARYGALDDLLAASAHISGTALWVHRKQYVLLDKTKTKHKDNDKAEAKTKAEESRFEGPYVISQVDTEAWLERRLAERGVQVEYAVAVTSLVQDEEGVTVVLRKAHGEGEEEEEETVRCKYVIGCDGAHSIVRHTMNVEFEGDAYPQDFILADTHLDWALEGLDRGTFQTMLGKGGLVMVFPMGKGRARITASRSAYSDDHHHHHRGGSSTEEEEKKEKKKGNDDEPTLQDFDEILAQMIPTDEAFPKPRLHDPFWLARFHLHHRCATKYRDGRLFIAGDAAHIHSPVGGQGMNAGIQDAINLGWKLARVLHGTTPSSPSASSLLLDSYHDERWPIGQHLLRQTDQLFSFFTNMGGSGGGGGGGGGGGLHVLRDLALPLLAPWLAHRPEHAAALLHYFSQLGVRYRRSPIVRTGAGLDGKGAPVRGGSRAPEGRVVVVVDGDGVVGENKGEEKWMLSLLRGTGYHLLVFFSNAAGGGDGGGSEKEEKEEKRAELVAQRIREELREEIQVHSLVSSTAADRWSGKTTVLVDVDGELRRRYGFVATKSAYVLVRPDGYVADIAYL